MVFPSAPPCTTSRDRRRFRVRDFGPLTVGIDAHGNSLYHDVQERAKKKLEDLYARL